MAEVEHKSNLVPFAGEPNNDNRHKAEIMGTDVTTKFAMYRLYFWVNSTALDNTLIDASCSVFVFRKL